MTKIVTIVQARTGSTRLPGKVLLPLAGEPMILRMLERLRYSRLCGKTICATSDLPGDDAVERTCADAGYEVFRGDESDVLDRYYRAAGGSDAEVVVRCTGDCPLIDPQVVDSVLEKFLKGGHDYVSNIGVRTFPHGLDTEAMSFEALERAWSEAKLPQEREHVTLYIRNHPELFRLGNVERDPPLSRYRWTVDHEEDYRLVSRIYEQLYREDRLFTTSEIVALLERQPELCLMNDHLAVFK